MTAVVGRLVYHDGNLTLAADLPQEDSRCTIYIDREQLFCNHDKCYSPMVAAVYPPVWHWVCRKCGATGEERDEYRDANEYKGLLKKFGVKEP